jgi:competence protein ComEC
MAGAYIIGKIIGRRGAALNSLLFAAFVMVLLNPYILWDIGFELSAAAMAGIILAEPLIKLNSVAFWQILFETLSAQIATLPILLVNFGRISLVAPATNILILPFVPLAMGLVAISIGFFTIFMPLGIIIGGVSAVLLNYFLFVIKSFGALSFASISTDKSQLGWLLYLPIAAIFYLIKFKLRNKGSLR